MPKKDPFIHKILNRLDRIDTATLKNHLRDFARQNLLLEQILDEANEGILILNEAGTVQYVNRQAALWLNIESAQQDRVSYRDVIPPSELFDFLDESLSSFNEKTVQTVQLMSPREMTLRACLIPLQDPPQRQTLLILLPILADVSAWNERLARIESLVKLAAGIAHEIGNPLNSIGIHLQLLKKEINKLPETKQKKLDKTVQVLQSETERLDNIIRNFLKATRKPPLRFKAENLNQVLDDAVTFMAPELKRRKITVRFQKDEGLRPFLIDRERLYQAFINIIKNAMEAMAKGGPLQITVKHKNQLATLQFKDKGEGIAEKDLPHIFDAYYTTKVEGSGLGLMTVFDAVREHGGRIEVDSKLKRGTTFSIYLPIRTPKLQIPEIVT